MEEEPLRPGADRHRDRRGPGVFLARAGACDETAGRRLHQAGEDGHCAGDLPSPWRWASRAWATCAVGRIGFKAWSTSGCSPPWPGYRSLGGEHLARRAAWASTPRISTAAGSPPSGAPQASRNIVSFLLHLVPDTFLGAFASGDLLQILVVALFFGVALTHSGEPGRRVHLLDDVSGGILPHRRGHPSFHFPGGALGAMAFTVNPSSAWPSSPSLAWLMVAVYATCALFIFVVLNAVAWWSAGFLAVEIPGVHPARTAVGAGHLLVGIGPAADAGAAGGAGCDRAVVGWYCRRVTPSIDGTCIYLTLAAVFHCPGAGGGVEPARRAHLAGRAPAHLPRGGRRNWVRLHYAGSDAGRAQCARCRWRAWP